MVNGLPQPFFATFLLSRNNRNSNFDPHQGLIRDEFAWTKKNEFGTEKNRPYGDSNPLHLRAERLYLMPSATQRLYKINSLL